MNFKEKDQDARYHVNNSKPEAYFSRIVELLYEVVIYLILAANYLVDLIEHEMHNQ